MRDQRDIQRKAARRVRGMRQDAGGNMHRIRLSRGLTLARLSRLSGLSITRLDQMEIGKGQTELFHFACVAQALDVGLEDIIRGDGAWRPTSQDGLVGAIDIAIRDAEIQGTDLIIKTNGKIERVSPEAMKKRLAAAEKKSL